VIKRIEQDTRLDLGPAYSISATHAKMPGTSMEGIDLIVTHDAIDPSRAKEPPESN